MMEFPIPVISFFLYIDKAMTSVSPPQSTAVTEQQENGFSSSVDSHSKRTF